MSLLLRLMFVAVLIEIIIASGVAGDPFGAEFVSPPPAGPAEDFAENLTWRVDDIQKVRWNASFSKYSIVLWQQMTPTMARRGPTILGTVHPSLSNHTEANAKSKIKIPPVTRQIILKSWSLAGKCRVMT